ncbi:MAG: thiamine phosphate synthase [Acinetobacter sp.]|nr:thiamine phosphate synthase [Acinetobacter sp.]
MRGLYLITNDDPFPQLKHKLTLALATQQIALLQYRRKHATASEKIDELRQLKQLCEHYHTPLIVNDDIQLAQQFALNVHLGQDDGEIAHARQAVGEQAIIGRTCMDSLYFAEQAVHDGADYIAFGAIYTSQSKQTQAKNIDLQILRQAKQQFPNMPICAIGGLTVENAAPVIAAGADLCAVIGDVLARDAAEIEQRVWAWSALF